ncbi:ABC transporter ATP-binding protein [Kitasatospora sp. NPDC048545]|uniref:ABC transporter ATP-binding protein n=1 Tax=Kitasatospora sp. NPDC048545 TaxID=3157208 RepID=UPI0033EB4AE5
MTNSRRAERGADRLLATRQLLALLRRAGTLLVAGTAALHALVGLLPVVFALCVGFALQAVRDGRFGDGGGLPGDGGGPSGWLAVALVAFVGQQALAPFQVSLSQAVAQRVDGACVARLLRSSFVDARAEVVESERATDQLSEANLAFDSLGLTPGAAAEGALALIARYARLAGSVALVAYACTWWAALGALAVALITRRGQTGAFHTYGRLFRRLAPQRRRMAYLRELATSAGAAKEVRTLGLTEWLDNRYQQEVRGYLDPLWRGRRAVYGPPFLRYSALGLLVGGAVLTAVAAAGADAGGTGTARFAIALQAAVMCLRFGSYFPESDTKLQYGRQALAAIVEFERLSAATPAEAARPAVACPPSGDLDVRSLCFRYDGGAAPVLDGVDLVLREGSSTAVVGLNGAGKTTLVKLLTGLYRPTSGTLRYNGVDLGTLDAAHWQRRLAVTFQDFVRYDLTLRENVALGSIEHLDDLDGIRESLERVGLGELLAALPDGPDTPLSRRAPGGTELSGGQWQRLALARSLFAVRHGASFLILDEPTAQLDARGEAEFFESFLDLTKGVTSLVISHRFSTVRRCEQIVVLDAGRISERGSHRELLARGGTYADLFTVQAKRFAARTGPVER